MFMSVGHKLFGLGHVRFGFRIKGSTAWIMICLSAILYIGWYILIGTLLFMWGTCYLLFYLPAKGIVKLCKSSKNSNHSTPSSTHLSSNFEDTPGQGPNKNKSDIVRWICVAIFGAMTLYALSTLSLLGILAALMFLVGGALIAPLPMLVELRSKLNINQIVSIILAVVLLFAGTIISPSTEDSNDNNGNILAEQTTEATTIRSTSSVSTTTYKESATTSKATTSHTTQDASKVTVYYTATGTRYHSRESCPGLSNANNIYSTDLETAKGYGLSPCSKCH